MPHHAWQGASGKWQAGAVATLLLWGASGMPASAQTVPAGYREQLRLEVVNAAGGTVRVSRDSGATWLEIGRVLHPAGRVNPRAYRAASWVPASTVAATAVNAVHLKIAQDAQTDRAITLSLVPQGEIEGDAEPSASIMLDTKPGEGIFGGLGPTVGSPVCLWQQEQWLPLPADYQPRSGDRLLILRMVPERQLRCLDFENVFGGKITATYQDGTQAVIGQVLTPVTGIGRFEGTRYADAGRLRANHAGVLDVSTSPYGMVGGFQIIPWDHANDSEMYYVRTNRQWLVVGPLDMREGSWEAKPPLFWGHLYPSWRADDLDHDNWAQRLLSRVQVLCRRVPLSRSGMPSARPDPTQGEWELLPEIAFSKEAPPESPRPPGNRLWLIHEPASPYEPLPRAAQTALADVIAFRLSPPLATYWPE